MRMLSERLQILVTPEQRRRLEREAERRNESVGSLIREAVDATFGGASETDRQEALDAIRTMRGSYAAADEINRIVEEEREALLDQLPR